MDEKAKVVELPPSLEKRRRKIMLIGAAAIGLEHMHNALFGADTPGGRMSLPPADAITLREVAG